MADRLEEAAATMLEHSRATGAFKIPEMGAWSPLGLQQEAVLLRALEGDDL